MACHALKARRRWCLTGTPIQNSIDDLFSIFKFLGRIAAPHHEQAHFQASISKKVKAGQRGALEVVLPVLMLRRTKMDQGADGEALLKLPQRHVEIIKCTFVDDDEQRFYDATKDRIALTMNKYIEKGSVMKDYTKVLVLLLRLRQGQLAFSPCAARNADVPGDL